MREYLVIIEQGPDNLSAYVPSLPGCVTTGKTRKEVIENIHEAIQGHLEVMAEYGDPIPDEDLDAVVVVVPELNVQKAEETTTVTIGI
jgi:predicted RNase H-like HicB family nuclease